MMAMYNRVELNKNEARLFAIIKHLMFTVFPPSRACTKRTCNAEVAFPYQTLRLKLHVYLEVQSMLFRKPKQN